MKSIIRGADVFVQGAFSRNDILIQGGTIAEIAPKLPLSPDAKVYNMDNCFVFPGLIDVHVHLREPGFSYKETIESGTMAAARGGFTTVCAMPNLDPVPDCRANLDKQLDIIRRDAVVNVLPYGSITVGEKQERLSDMAEIAKDVVAFSDDGVGVRDADTMETAMRTAKSLGKLIAAHCEDMSLTNGGCVHNGEYARAHGLRGIPSESEWRQIERDIELVRRTGCAYHVCHVSCARSVDLIRRAKAERLPVTCETAPHYLLLCDADLMDEGRFKMNPPIRAASDREALIEGIRDGTIDIIATDHAPHSAQEKSFGLEMSLNGIVGLETAFPVLFTRLVRTEIITLERLTELMSLAPARIFGVGCPLRKGESADLTVFNLNERYTIDPREFLSKGRATPFESMEVCGRCKLTMVGGKAVWEDDR